jgi:hypothetical protein
MKLRYTVLVASPLVAVLAYIAQPTFAQTDVTPYLLPESVSGTGGCPLMSRTAFQELQNWNKYQWNLNNTLKRYNKIHGSQKGISELNTARQKFLEEQKKRRTEYTQAYGAACGKGAVSQGTALTAGDTRMRKKGERLANRIMRATIQRSYNQTILKTIRKSPETLQPKKK